MFKKCKGFFKKQPTATTTATATAHAVTERSIVLHPDQITENAKKNKYGRITLTAAQEIHMEDSKNKEFFDKHPLALGFGHA